jgi:hypothetical protein
MSCIFFLGAPLHEIHQYNAQICLVNIPESTSTQDTQYVNYVRARLHKILRMSTIQWCTFTDGRYYSVPRRRTALSHVKLISLFHILTHIYVIHPISFSSSVLHYISNGFIPRVQVDFGFISKKNFPARRKVSNLVQPNSCGISFVH